MEGGTNADPERKSAHADQHKKHQTQTLQVSGQHEQTSHRTQLPLVEPEQREYSNRQGQHQDHEVTAVHETISGQPLSMQSARQGQ